MRLHKMSECAFGFALTPVAKSAPLSKSELKNLLAAIRQNRTHRLIFRKNE
jgi:hypothetical protein